MDIKSFVSENKIQIAVIAVAITVGLVSYFVEQGKPADIQSAVIYGATPSPATTSIQVSNDSCVSISDARTVLGLNSCVYGKVERIYISQSGTIFLDFCKNYKTCPFSSVIFVSSANKFPNIKSLERRVIEVSGKVKTYQGRPEIVIEEPSQIKIVR